jgi:Domain of unknown function (DUF4783)
MKFLLVFFTFLLPASQQITPNLAPVTKAISEGDAATLSNYLADAVDLTLMDKQQVYDKAQATNLLRDFFSKNKPRSFNTVHQGSAKGAASHYTIGDLSATSGSFRVYLYYKSSGERPVIEEIRIEK